jgi:hypothetical protein
MEKIQVITRGKLREMYLDSEKNRRRIVTKKLFDTLRNFVVEKNEEGETSCNIEVDNEVEIVQNLVYNLRLLFTDSEIDYDYDETKKKYFISFDWSLPEQARAYIIKSSY